MRVLSVGNMYPPHHLGGYELVWRAATSALRARGHEVRVLTTDFRTGSGEPDEPGTFRELRWYWHEHEWPRVGWRERLALERHNAAVLERHLREAHPEVVSWWAMGGMSLALIERVRRRQIPAVAFVHDDWLVYGPSVDRWLRPFRRRPRLAALAERLTGLPARVDFEHAARYAFVSETTRAHARAAGVTPAGSAIAHSGIDAAFLRPAQEQPWRWRLLYVGRLDQRKGVLDALEALAELPAETTLMLAGAGEHRFVELLRERARELEIEDRVVELGLRSAQSLPGVYADADAVLFPVRWEEPWGLVPLEAMGVGRPVIATARGGSAEYLRDRFNCLIVPAADPSAVAEAVRRLAEDAELRTRLRGGGIDTATRHTAAEFNDAAGRMLEEAAARSGDEAAQHAP